MVLQNIPGNKVYRSKVPAVTARLLPPDEANGQTGLIEVVAVQDPIANFETIFGWPDVPPITVSARAETVGGGNVCVISLSENQSQAFNMSGSAEMAAAACQVFSNSTSAMGLSVTNSARLNAEAIYSGGGTMGGTTNFSPAPVLDYPGIEDPLRHRTPPSVSMCDYNNVSIKGGVQTLQPGVYCGGLDVKQGADVTLAPGIYVIKDGQFKIFQDSRVTGTGVGFFLSGNKTKIMFFHESFVSVSAPEVGPMAGLLFFDDPDRVTPVDHRISSDNARYLVGTIYMPNANLVIDSDQPIADQSEYTAIVAREIKLTGSPKLVINADYDLTDVPVPEGLGPQNAQSRLVQ